MRILAIETSCDETSIAILEADGGSKEPKFTVIAHTLLSQVLEHQKYGGVYPNLAKRLHKESQIPILKETLRKASLENPSTNPGAELFPEIETILEREHGLWNEFKEYISTIKRPDIDLIAVTQGPGLEPALWVGLNFAKALSRCWNIPLVPVNHMEGHVMSVLWHGNNLNEKSVDFPALALLVSGGHTQLVLVNAWTDYVLLGETRDDAAGEAFDKVARLLGLPYPGGPQISTYAEESRKRGNCKSAPLPRPMIHTSDYDFSFSGLKTAVRYRIEQMGSLSKLDKEEIAREFEDAVVDVLVSKTKRAISEYSTNTLIIGGGVIANKRLRETFKKLEEEFSGLQLLLPTTELATDNAVMIGIVGYIRMLKKNVGVNVDIRAEGNLALQKD